MKMEQNDEMKMEQNGTKRDEMKMEQNSSQSYQNGHEAGINFLSFLEKVFFFF